MDTSTLISILAEAAERLEEQLAFDSGHKFRDTQGFAIMEYADFFRRKDLTDEQKLTGFFELPTGIGKSAIIAGIVDKAIQIAEERGLEFRVWIVVPRLNLAKQLGGDPDDIDYVGDFQKFAPHSNGKIGFVDGDQKDYSKPITIITYPSWLNMEEGDKQQKRPQMLISDEGHRGLSERRVAAFNEYKTSCACIAFSATASFDKEKSIETTHVNRISYMPLPTAIRNGELAAYIQVYGYEIRVEPMDELELGIDNDWRYQAKVRQAAWNKKVVELYRDKYDRYTGGLLSDNQAGFYCDGIAQANQLEEMLNNDEELWARAKRMGKDGVAVAIHSDMSSEEKEQRLKDYKAGKYMAIIGDEMFKEGFDHPPMKTVFDYPRGSLVDKAQILGRGARQWWNEAKQRYEGLTFIDTFVYIGSHDNKIDGERRHEALMKTITARKVLEDSIILGPHIHKPKTTTGGCPIGPEVLDPQWIDATSLEDHECGIWAEREELKKSEDRINVNDIMYELLKSKIDNINRGYTDLARQLNLENIGITAYVITNLYERSTRTTTLKQWEALMQGLEIISPSEIIPITDEYVDKLNYHSKRAGVGSRQLAALCKIPELNEFILNSWKVRTTRVAKSSYLSTALSIVSILPDRVSLEAETIVEIRRLMLETGHTVETLAVACATEGINTKLVSMWTTSAVDTILKPYLDRVLAVLRTAPKTGRKIIEVPKGPESLHDAEVEACVIEEMKARMEKTACSQSELVALCNIEGLYHHAISRILNNRAKVKDMVYIPHLISTLRLLPEKRILITDEIISEFKHLFEHSHLTKEDAAKACNLAGFGESQISRWLVVKKGNTYAEPEQVMALRSILKANQTLIRISDEYSATLKGYMDDTGIHSKRLCDIMQIHGVSPGRLNDLVRRKGTYENSELIRKVLAFYEHLLTQPELATEYTIALESDFVAKVKRYIKQTSITCEELARRLDIEELSGDRLRDITGSKTKRLSPKYQHAIINLLENLLDITSDQRTEVNYPKLRPTKEEWFKIPMPYKEGMNEDKDMEK